MNRRGFLGSILAACAAPAIVRADSLMRILPMETTLYIPNMAPVILVPGRIFSCTAAGSGLRSEAMLVMKARMDWALKRRRFPVRDAQTFEDRRYDIGRDEETIILTAQFNEEVPVYSEAALDV